MNRLLVIATMCGTMLIGQKLADFAPYQKDEGTKGTILSLDFEKGAPPEMVIAKGYQCGWGYGENGNGGLMLKRGPGEKYVFSNLRIPNLKAGNVYKTRKPRFFGVFRVVMSLFDGAR